jgi:hypothetical protein
MYTFLLSSFIPLVIIPKIVSSPVGRSLVAYTIWDPSHKLKELLKRKIPTEIYVESEGR